MMCWGPRGAGGRGLGRARRGECALWTSARRSAALSGTTEASRSSPSPGRAPVGIALWASLSLSRVVRNTFRFLDESVVVFLLFSLDFLELFEAVSEGTRILSNERLF